MLKKLLLIVTCVGLSHGLFASHIAGGEITYQCLGGNQYRFFLNLYVDCAGIELDEFQSLNMTSSCGGSETLNLTLNNPGGTEISQLCASQTGNTNCNGGTHPGMLGFYFTGDITLTPCDTWTIGWSDCCRNEAVVNLQTPDSDNHYIETTLNSVKALCNNSSVFVNEPIPYTCVNQELNYSFGVNEPDGDSVRYTLVGARGDVADFLGYSTGFSATNPIDGLTLDSITGLVNFTPITIGNYVVVVLVEEYDQDGNLIGSIMRDIQFVVQNCTNEIPNSTDGAISNLSPNAVLVDPYTLSVCNGSTVSFDATFGDLDAADSLFLTTNILDILPGAIVVVTGVNPLAVSITADVNTLSENDVLYFEVNIRDNACPVIGRQDFVYQINLMRRTIATADTTICGTQEAVLNAYFGTTFNWSVISGDPISVGANFTCNPCANPFASPAVTTVYEVVSDLSVGCVNRDTVTVTVGTDFTSTLTVDVDSTLCSLHIATLVIDNQPADTYTYSWTNGQFLDNATIPNPDTDMQPGGTYEFIYTTRNSSGCVKMDSVTLTSLDSPVISVAGDTMLCVGESSQLVMSSGVVLEDNFDGALNSDLWTSVNGATLNTSCGSVTGNALHFNTATRIAETNPINTTTGGTITFDLVIGSGVTPCESADFGEDVLLEYSIDGGTNWIIIDTYLTTAFNNFTEVTLTIPAGAMTSSTKFRWTQPNNSGSGSDNWAIDNVNITITSDLSSFTRGWFEGGSLISNQDTLNVSPVVETTYHYIMTHNTTSCVIQDSITVHASPLFGFISSNDTAACVPLVFDIHSTPDLAGDYNYIWAPTTGLSSSTDSLVTVATLTEPTTYVITVTSVDGCTQTDTIDVHMTNLILPTISGDTMLCEGETSLLSLAQQIDLFDDFDGATINIDLWSSVGGGLLNTDCGSVSGNALHFDDAPREATTNTFNTTGGGTITFNLLIGSDFSPCEDADFGEDVLLEYSIDGGANWILIDTYLVDDFITFTQITVNIPPGAMTTATRFRWNQPDNSGFGSDNWAIDNVTINVTSAVNQPNTVIEWFEGTNLLTTGDSLSVSPLTATYYRFELRDTISNCVREDSILVHVSPVFGFISSNDTAACVPAVFDIHSTPNLAGDYNYLWVPATGLSSSTDSLVTVATLTVPVTYLITVTSVDGCTQTDTIDVHMTNLILPTISGDTMLCEGESTVLRLAVTSQPDTEIEWFEGTTSLAMGDSLVLTTPLATAYYRFVYRDTISECFLEDSVLVRVGPLFTLNTTPDQILCDPASLNLTVTPSLVDDFTFTWTPATGLSSTSDSTVVANPSNSVDYAIEITSASGCTQNDTIEIYIANLVPPIITGDTLLCIGDSTVLNMLMQVTVSDQLDGATPNPDLWSDVTGGTLNTDCGSVSGTALHFDGGGNREATTNSFNTIAGGTITFDLLIGTDFSPCEAADPGDEVVLEYSIDGGNNWILIDTYLTTDFGTFTQVIVNIPPGAMTANTQFRWSQPSFSGTGFDNWAIDNVSIQIGGAAQIGTYTSNWFTGGVLVGTLDSLSIKPITNTTYDYVFTDNFSACTVSKQVNVLVNQGFTLTTTADTSVCPGSVVALSTVPSEAVNYTYTWSPAGGLSVTNAANTNATVNATIEYFVTAVSEFGCTVTDSVLLTMFPVFTVLVSGNDSICIGDSTVLTATGAESYVWDNANSLNDDSLAVVTANPTLTTLYTIVGTVGVCTNTANFTVTVNPLPTGLADAVAELNCITPNSALNITSAGNTIVWNGPGLTNAANPASATTPGTYIATISSLTTGCIDTMSVVVTLADSIDAAFVANPTTGISPLLVDFTNGSENAVSYEWYFGENSQVNATSIDTVNIYEQPGTYLVRMVATNALGCTDTAFVTIVVLQPITGCGPYTIEIPNIITANGDQINDVLTITHNIQGSFGYDCMIVNRWGNVVYESNDFNKPWDGKTTKGEECSAGVYFYKITFTCDEEETVLRGTVQLVTPN